jgi:hypothetical protein
LAAAIFPPTVSPLPKLPSSYPSGWFKIQPFYHFFKVFPSPFSAYRPQKLTAKISIIINMNFTIISFPLSTSILILEKEQE